MTRLSRFALMFLLLAAVCPVAAAQEPEPPAKKEAAEGEEAPFDPLRAEQNLKIGEFYLKKGNTYAAIQRFQEAIRYKPNFAKAHLRLGEAYEKDRQRKPAVDAYKKYLEILPSADDAEKIRKRIEKLERRIQRDARRARPG